MILVERRTQFTIKTMIAKTRVTPFSDTYSSDTYSSKNSCDTYSSTYSSKNSCDTYSRKGVTPIPASRQELHKDRQHHKFVRPHNLR